MTNLTKETKAEISHVTNDTIKSMLEHRSIRDFTDEPISEEMLEAILEAGRACCIDLQLHAVDECGSYYRSAAAC